jgi:HPt (histidine-containing phosphotransfer) domain-containing protein
MFLENGFNDFISKPIDVDKLQEIVQKYLPREKVSVKSSHEGKPELKNEILEFFYKKLLGERDKMSEFIKAGDFKMFSITIHAMKSSLATVGETELSVEAAKLEAESKAGNHSYCTEVYPDFSDKLTALNERLKVIFAQEDSAAEKEPGNLDYLKESIPKIITAAEDFDSDAGLELLKELIKFDYGESVNQKLEKAKTAFDDFDCDGVIEILRDFASS